MTISLLCYAFSNSISSSLEAFAMTVKLWPASFNCHAPLRATVGVLNCVPLQDLLTVW